MNFLAKNYEKILLAVLLTVFIVLLLFQLVLWNHGRQIQVEKQKSWKQPSPNYILKVTDKEFSTMIDLDNPNVFPVWGKTKSRMENEIRAKAQNMAAGVADFMNPLEMSVCPFCKLFVPLASFPPADSTEITQCPFCNKNLPAPISKKNVNVDTDNDGIPDKDELRLTMNPNNSSDATQDWDSDGFTNLEEYLYHTNIQDPKSRPQFTEMLYVTKIERPILNFKLKNVTFAEKDGKKVPDRIQIEFQIVHRKKKKTPSKFFSLNDEFAGGTERFKIVKVEPRFIKNKLGMPVNESRVIIQKVSNDKESLTLEIDRQVMENKYVITIQPDPIALASTKQVKALPNLAINAEFKVGNLKTGIEQYKIIGIDEKGRRVTLMNLLNNKQTIVLGPESNVQNKLNKFKSEMKQRKKTKVN